MAEGSETTPPQNTGAGHKRTERFLTYLGSGNSVADTESDTLFPVGVEMPASQATIERLTKQDPSTRGEPWNVREVSK